MDFDRIEGCETARYSGVATAKRYQRVVDTEFAQMTRHNTGPVTGCGGSEPIIVGIKVSTSSDFKTWINSTICVFVEVIKSCPFDCLNIGVNSEWPEGEFPSNSVCFQELLLNKNSDEGEQLESVRLGCYSGGR